MELTFLDKRAHSDAESANYGTTQNREYLFSKKDTENTGYMVHLHRVFLSLYILHKLYYDFKQKTC